MATDHTATIRSRAATICPASPTKSSRATTTTAGNWCDADVVAVPCLTPFGRRLGKRDKTPSCDPCADAFLRLQMFGKLLIAENLRDCLWSLELLAQHDQVDAKRLGCVGLSYGGRMTMLTTAMEPRVRVAAISGALNVMQERISKPYSCGAQIIPGLLNFGDVPEISSLIAP